MVEGCIKLFCFKLHKGILTSPYKDNPTSSPKLNLPVPLHKGILIPQTQPSILPRQQGIRVDTDPQTKDPPEPIPGTQTTADTC